MTAQVPLMITQKMRADLWAAGFSDADIRQMTPAQAWENLGGMPDTGTLSTNGELALSLAGRGWHVFPCREQPGKPYTPKSGGVITPAVKSPYWDKSDLRNGKDDATTEPDTIRRWWQRWPGALVGIYCEKSGIWALDIDCKNGVDGNQSFRELVNTHGGGRDVEVGAVQRTPSGGFHAIFNLPADGSKIPNNAGKLGPGLDLRSDGYICTGKLPDAGGYTWLDVADWSERSGPGEVTDAPGWLLGCIRNLNGKQPSAPADAKTDINPPPPDAGGYWLKHFLQGAVNGNRNSNGFALACQLRDSGLSESEAGAVMRDYAARVPGDGYSESEALASLKQAYQSPRREPARVAALTPPGGQTTATPQPNAKGRFRLLTAADALQPQPPVCWLVDRLFTAGSLNIVFGLPGAKKTWALLDMAVCVAAGAAWLGLKTQAGPVLLVDEESGERRLLRRLGDVIRGRELENADIPVSAVSLAGLNLRNPDDVNQLHDLILQTGAAVVVIDALADIMPGADENSVKDVQPVMLALRQVADRTQSAIILIHHANKTGLQYRGSTALPGAVDCMMQVTSATGDNRIDFDIVKSRDGEPFQFAALAGWDIDLFNLSPAGEKQARLSESQHRALVAISGAGGSMTAAQSESRDAIYKLRNAGYLYRSDTGGQGVTAIYSLTDKGRAYLDENLL